MNLPPLDLALRQRRRFRHTVVASANTWPITREECLNIFYMGTGTTTGRRIVGSVRLVALEFAVSGAYPTTASTALISFPDVKWLGGGPQTKVSQTFFSADRARTLRTSPPPNSLAGFWSQTGIDESEVLCEITAGSGTVIDFILDFVIQNDDPLIASALVTSSANTAGIVYYCGFGGAGSTIVPQCTPVNYAT